MPDELSADEARRLQLYAQGFIGPPPGARDRHRGQTGGAGAVTTLVRHLGAVQLDTVSVLARSHELVAYARLGPVGRAAVESALWGGGCFEYWAHAACVIPLEDWPMFGARRAAMGDRVRGNDVPPSVMSEVRAKLADGPLTTADLGGSKINGTWWSWTEHKIAIEQLLALGEAVCIERRGWRRVYDLTERRVPADLRAIDLPSDECNRRMLRLAGRRLGVGTLSDLSDYYRMPRDVARRAIDDAGLVAVTVRGWRDPAWADSKVLTVLASGTRLGRHRTTLLSPFDSLMWQRTRVERVFGFVYELEIYVPRHKRKHGYYTMPVIAGGRVVGLVDPARDGRTLVARNVVLHSRRAMPAVATALWEAASWVGCDSVEVERVVPEEDLSSFRRLVSAGDR